MLLGLSGLILHRGGKMQANHPMHKRTLTSLRLFRAGDRGRYATLSRPGLLRGAQQRMMAHGQDIPPQGAAEIF